MEESKINTYAAVLYTDGSALNPGPFGAGVHGFMYCIDSDNKSSDKPTGYGITTKGYIENSHLAKEEFTHVVPIGYFDSAYAYGNEGTNNQAEAKAFIDGSLFAIKVAEENNFILKELYVKTDSMYVLNMIVAIKRNPDTNWLNKDNIPNNHIIQEMSDMLKFVKEKDIEIKPKKVLGHSTAIGNHFADRLALLGRDIADSKNRVGNFENFVLTNKYWKPTIDRPLMLTFKQLFYMNNTYPEGHRPMYSVINYEKKETEPGAKSNNALFGLIQLHERVKVIDDIQKVYLEKMGTLSIISAMELNNIYSARHLYLYDLFGDDIYIFNKRGKRSVTVLQDETVSSEIYPPGLARTALDKSMVLEKIFKDFTSSRSLYTYIDITDDMYVTTEDKKGKQTTKCTIGPKEVGYTYDYITSDKKKAKIILQYGRDTLTRNTLAKMADPKTRCYIAILETTPNVVEYYAITYDGANDDFGIWYNFYSNKVLVK